MKKTKSRLTLSEALLKALDGDKDENGDGYGTPETFILTYCMMT